MSNVQITKLEAAGRQLSAAVRLFAWGDDPIAVHGLGLAAHQVLHDLSLSIGAGPMLARQSAPVFPGVVPGDAARIAKQARDAANFFKHADRQPNAVLLFDESESEHLLYDACARHHTLSGAWASWLKAFVCWYIAGRPDQFRFTPAMSGLCDSVVAARQRMDRRGFFDWVRESSILRVR